MAIYDPDTAVTRGLDLFADTDRSLKDHVPNFGFNGWTYSGAADEWKIISNKGSKTFTDNDTQFCRSNNDILDDAFEVFIDYYKSGAGCFQFERSGLYFLAHRATAIALGEGVEVAFVSGTGDNVNIRIIRRDSAGAEQQNVLLAAITIGAGASLRLGATVSGVEVQVWTEPAGGGGRTDRGSATTLTVDLRDGYHKRIGLTGRGECNAPQSTIDNLTVLGPVLLAASNRNKFPLIVYGDAEDLSAWDDVATPVVSGSQDDPFGGTGAFKVADNNTGSQEYVKKTVVLTEDGAHTFAVIWKESIPLSAARESLIQLADTTDVVIRGEATINWQTLLLEGVTGAVIAHIEIGDNWFLTLIEATGIIAVNDHEIRLRPTKELNSEMGATLFYIRPVLIVGDPLNQVNSFSEPRVGSRFVQASSGAEDGWIVGQDYLLEGTVRWIPFSPTVDPRPTSGWAGAGELAGVNNGWDDFFALAQDKQIFLWVPDRTKAAVNVSSYLVDPLVGGPALEANDTRRLSLKIRSSDGSRYEDY